MGWIYLGLAIAFEVAGTISMKLANGWQVLTFSISTVVLYGICFGFFGLALKTLPVSVSYAVWSGAGIVLILTVDILFFGQALTPLKAACFAAILAGAIGLSLMTESA